MHLFETAKYPGSRRYPLRRSIEICNSTFSVLPILTTKHSQTRCSIGTTTWEQMVTFSAESDPSDLSASRAFPKGKALVI